MIDHLDRELGDWIQAVVGPVEVRLRLDPAGGPDQGVLLRLLDLEPDAAARSQSRPPLKGRARYLISTWHPDPAEAHRILGEIFFAALDDNGLDLEVEPMALESRQALGLGLEPAFLIRVPILRERPQPKIPMVRKVVLQQSPMRRLHGVVLGPEDRPILGAAVELPALRLQTRSDARGHWQFPRVPAEPRSRQLHVRAKGRELAVTTDAAAADDEPVVIRFELES